jgi:hypothetical protein
VIEWDEGSYAHLSSNDIWRDLRAASEKDGVVAKSRGDIAKGLATGERFEASYELPFLAHAAMEPLNPRFISSRTPVKSGPAPRSLPECSRRGQKRRGFRSKK